MDKLELVICDIDSTLITEDQRLTPYTKNVIDRLHAHGVRFGIASGRPVDEVSQKARIWGFDYEFDVLIGMNGSELWDERQKCQFDYYKLKTEWIKEILEWMAPYHGNPLIYDEHDILCGSENQRVWLSSKKSGKKIRVAKKMEEFYEKENAKMMFRVNTSQMREIEERLKLLDAPYAGFKTQPDLIEFADKRISKAYALEKYCEMNQFTLDHVVAFGDTTNDNTMIECSGLGVCMCNGSDDTKAVADMITEKTNDEDGFADFMEKHFLSKYGW